MNFVNESGCLREEVNILEIYENFFAGILNVENAIRKIVSKIFRYDAKK